MKIIFLDVDGVLINRKMLMAKHDALEMLQRHKDPVSQPGLV